MGDDSISVPSPPSDIVARDCAEDEFERFALEMDLDVDTSRMDDDDRAGFANQRDVILRAIQRGKLVINEAGEPVLTLTSGSSLTFREPDGGAMLAMDKKKPGHLMAKQYAFMAAITESDAITFTRMPNRDLKVATAITTLFLG